MRLAYIAAAALFLGACQPAGDAAEASPAPRPQVISSDGHFDRVAKICDAGRAVYVYNADGGGGIAIVEQAPECAQPEGRP